MLNSEKMLASIQSQDLKAAETYFEKALKEDDSETLLALGDYLQTIGFYPQAKQVYLQLQAEFPEVHINLAQMANEDGHTEEAFRHLDAIGPDSPDYIRALLVKADLYDAEGLSDVAREKLLEASQLSSEPLILFGLAEIDLNLGYFQEAIHYYAQLDNRAILEDTGISTYERIGRAYANMGKFETAIEFLEKAVEIEFEEATVFELAVLLYEQEEYQKANLYFKQLDSMNPDFPGYEYVYAQSLHKEHKTQEALRLLQQGLAKNDFDSRLLLLASQFSYELHQPKEAESYLERALEVAEDDEEALMRLSNLYLEEERFEEVVNLNRKDIENVLTRWNIAKAYRELERDEDALRIFEELSADLSDNPDFLQDYIYLLLAFGDKDKAKLLLEHYLQLVPDDANMADLKEQL
ncbi:tetratricopeptide repeat protein [Streptococcus macacae]|uniref:Tetratricopeptide repeat protein n=1 Tax=Streptococcus macacae NCTC 11558 TaxID=764298 RepID=G5JVN1_9STRE|nr:tetratricopeptide repeat protein [Streptococcus macacae]EHJ51950.1 tetratricopeptide repeat protein [Streptococcus macacae NCTC 11558]SUN78699.1 TPR repeat-containing protein [Streptococcus macacae NCTC 11558]